ncbi:MAG: bifunctional UDP-3-O-[3-hydroxymyristoyl] N-acetylglucosamine deacetylase/3-hydroxyacyl-ACP dehydratase [Bacteroidales bacterium]|jgi:UDP-3-O-[3-hydroxymyristoyl] N-acetylglucosamine deacetylase/3-hydroxyacyl-[acyl-carrier-protein] dehydratase|nr:bifunctional UDP-3-O-[3-hydroxymyristoyl] N-acetylglucosamine deacetylase/3-hydroxyacyl-ACP dehydratase [Bacteroidales bacterium]
MLQQTIKKSFRLSGKGLHEGKKVTLTFNPAQEGHGIKFQRIDVAEKPIIEALATNVCQTMRGTSLQNYQGYKVKTVEHVMAALSGCNVHNVLIEIDAEEVPILDGSSLIIANAILKAGILPQEKEQDVYVLQEIIRYEDKENNVELTAIPSDSFKLSVSIDYKTKVLGSVHADWNETTDFVKEIAPNRTFCFLHELLPLIKSGLIKGGDVDNAVIYVEETISDADKKEICDFFKVSDVVINSNGVLNNVPLYYNNEAARHKLLDLIGDLALTGIPLRAHIIARCPGHTANNVLAKMLLDKIKKDKNTVCFDLTKEPLYKIEDIQKILPHRPPFLLIDRVMEMDNTRVIGTKNVTINEPFFVGHFPEEPVMPGVLIMEGLAQMGGILALGQVPDPENYLTYFLKMDKVRWRKKVVPGDTLVYEMVLAEPIRRGIVHMLGKAYVNNKLVAEGDLMAQIVKVK